MFGHTFLFNGSSLFFIVININTEDIEIMTEQMWNYVVNKNMLNNPECFIILIL